MSEKYKEIICAECGILFLSHTRTMMYCSESCRSRRVLRKAIFKDVNRLEEELKISTNKIKSIEKRFRQILDENFKTVRITNKSKIIEKNQIKKDNDIEYVKSLQDERLTDLSDLVKYELGVRERANRIIK